MEAGIDEWMDYSFMSLLHEQDFNRQEANAACKEVAMKKLSHMTCMLESSPEASDSEMASI